MGLSKAGGMIGIVGVDDEFRFSGDEFDPSDR